MNMQVRGTRRRLIQRTGLAAALVGSTLVLPSRIRAQTQDRDWHAGDPLRLAGSTSGLPSLDPALARDIETNLVLRQIYRGLVSLDERLEPRPELAEAIDVSADGLIFSCTIREGVRFHDGTPISPERVRDSWTRALDPATAGGNRDNLAAITYLRDIAGAGDVLSGASTRLAGVQVTGDRTLSIALSDPSPAFLMKLASVPASIVDTSASIPNGSGPYAVEAWDPAASLTLRASPTWWAGEPATTSIQIRLGISASQPLNLYQAGEIDLVRNVQPELVDLVEDPASGISYGDLMVSNKFAVSYIALGNTEPPLDDVHVRRALRMVFPSALVAESTYRGEAIPATGLLPPGMLGESWDVPPEVSGTGAARAELAKSRYGDAAALPPIPIHAADPTAVEALRDVAAAELGLTVQAIAVAWPDFVPGLAKHRFPAYALYWEADYPDPESMIDMLFASDSADNYTGYTNPELDALLLEAHVSDRAGRVAAYHLANQLLVEDGAVIPLCHWRAHTLVRKGIAGVTPTAMGIRGLESIHAAG